MGLQSLKGLVFFCMLFYTACECMVMEQITDCVRNNSTLHCKGIIPINIPDGVTGVIVTDYFGGTVSSDMFAGPNWEMVERFSLTSSSDTGWKVMPRAFQNLKNLKSLGLQGIGLLIQNDSFVGIGVIDNLDLSGCLNIRMLDLLGALNGSERTTQIASLNISSLSFYNDPIKLDSLFANILQSKQISILDVSHTVISEWDLGSFTDHLCDTLSYLYVKNCRLPNKNVPFRGKCASLRYLNMDGTYFIQVFPKRFPSNVVIPLNFSDVHMFNMFSNIDMVIFDNVLESGLPPMYNVTLESLTNFTIGVKRLSMANNRIQYLDVKFIKVISTIEYLDMSSNGLTYLRPDLLSGSDIRTLNLSNNNLYEMAENNFTDFGTLFKYLKFLQHIDISANKLVVLPFAMFKFNTYLKSIDLSDNDFEQIECQLSVHPFLVNINLSRNKFSLLSSSSMKVFKQLASAQKIFQVDLRHNKLLCNQCKSKAFIAWLCKNSRIVVTDNTCLGQHNTDEFINESTVSKLEDMCTRTMRIVVITVSSFLSGVTLVATAFAIMACKKKKIKTTKLKNTIDKFRQGQHKFKYLTFLAFSGEDEDFVEDFVTKPLVESFKRMIGTDRELICTGDRHFKPGHSIAQQMEECCLQSGVVVLVVSKSFCASNHCTYETRIAFTMNKPIILVFKEIVPETDMTPMLRTIFKQYTRVIFKQEGDELRMSTTWDNVCESIFDLIINNP